MAHLRLLSKELIFAAVDATCLYLITAEADFLVVNDKEISFEGGVVEEESVKRLDQFVRLAGKLKAMCFAEK